MPRSSKQKDYMHSAIITKITKLFFSFFCKSRQTTVGFALHGPVMKLRATHTWVENAALGLMFWVFLPQLKNSRTDKTKLKRSSVITSPLIKKNASSAHAPHVLNRFGISLSEDEFPAGTCANTAAMTYP